MKPVFIFSLPRAGSTLLQRILTSHTDICSSAEPWLLLPFLYIRKKSGMLSEYSHFSGYTALNEFVDGLPHKEDDYNESLREFVSQLYEKRCSNNEIYFIDKTPRYYLIIPEIVNLFPDAKFIFLFRNPAHVFSSIISTFGKGRLNKLHGYQIDIKSGADELAAGYDLYKDKAYAVQYEDLIKEPDKYISEIFDYLEITTQSDVLTQFSQVKLPGSMGDPTGVKKYSSISTDSLHTWGDVIDSWVKKHVLLNFIKAISDDTFEKHGYSKAVVVEEVGRLNVEKLGVRDLADLMRSSSIPALNLNLFFSQDGKWTKEKYIS